MKKTEKYKNCTLDARAYERKDNQGWMAEFYIAQWNSESVVDTQFTLKATFPSAGTAIEAALQAGRHKVNVGFEPKNVVEDIFLA